MSNRVINVAILWSGLDVLLRQGCQFGIGMVLARLISPTEFGLIGLLLFFTSIAGLFVESGFGSALIQMRDHTREDESTIFWFNLAAGTVMALALVVAAPWIADFYNQTRLVPLIWAMAFNLWMSGWLTVHTSLLTKKLDFRTQMRASLMATITAGAIAILLAFKGAGVWALIAQTLIATAVNVMMVWWLHSWRPAFIFRWDSFKRLFNFGGFLLFSSLLDTIASRSYTILIGKFYSIHDLGIYNQAMMTKNFPQNILGSVFSRVAFPVLSSQSCDPVQLKRRLKSAIQLMMAINLPVMFGVYVVADNLVPVLFGPQWLPSVRILQVLCGAGVLWPMHLANLNILMAQGHSNLFFRLEVLKQSILLLLILTASHWGILAIAYATVISSVLSFFINAYYTQKFLGYSAIAQLFDIAPYATVAFSMALLLTLLGIWLDNLPHTLKLVLQVLVGVAFYLGVGHILGLSAFRHLQEIFRTILRSGARVSPDSGKT